MRLHVPFTQTLCESTQLASVLHLRLVDVDDEEEVEENEVSAARNELVHLVVEVEIELELRVSKTKVSTLINSDGIRNTRSFQREREKLMLNF